MNSKLINRSFQGRSLGWFIKKVGGFVMDYLHWRSLTNAEPPASYSREF
ncbi:MAG: hypothetical protein ACRC8Y_13235 [Chroococcales cyanobacterium]